MDFPFREPCGGFPLRSRCCYNNDPLPVLRDKYTNTTVVPNWDTGVGGTIPAYERWTPDPSGALACETHHCVAGGAPCVAWPQPYIAQTWAHTPGDQVNFAVPHKRGHKAVEAARQWHGCFGWTSPDALCPDILCGDGTTRRGWQGTPDQTKYLTLTVDAHYNVNWDDTDGATQYSYISSASGACSVTANSGESTSTLETFEDDSNQPDSMMGTITQTLHVVGGAGWQLETGGVVTYASGMSTMIDEVVSTDVHCGHVTIPADPFFGGVDLLTAMANWNATYVSDPTKQFPAVTDLNNYDHTVAFSIAEPDGSTRNISYRIMWARTNTVYSWDVDYSSSFSGTISGNPETQTAHFYGSMTLSDPNTVANVRTDQNLLLAYWPLNDDALYPFRPGQQVSVCPRVSRKEIGPATPLGWKSFTVDDLTLPINDPSGNVPFSAGWTPTYTQRAWFDPAVNQWQFAPGTDQTNSASTGLLKIYDGSVVGAPMPAGYQDYFNFGFAEWLGCCYMPLDSPGSHFWDWYPVGWGKVIGAAGLGGFNGDTGSDLPRNSTDWTNYFQAVNKPIGAFIFYADKGDYYGGGCINSDNSPSKAGDAGMMVARKYAEIPELWPSQNFALPAGDMKFWFDETRVYCATNASGAGAGSTWNLIDPVTGVAPPDATDFGGTWGGPVSAGFYAVTSYAAGVLTLGAKAWNVPSNWASKSNGDDAMCFGKLRYPAAPALLGRIAITPDLAGTTMTFAAAQPAFGMNTATHQEQVDLYDAAMNILDSNVTATRVDDSTFSVPTSHLTARFATIHGVKYYLNDTSPKGDYAVLEWTSDFRSPGEWLRLEGVLDCDGVQIARPATITYLDADCLGHNATVAAPGNGFAKFCQTPGCLPFVPCSPKVVCISPNGETWPNGITYDFPAEFMADETYGSKWWAYVQSTMTDLFWQPPHRPCNIEVCAHWQMDGGDCAGTSPGDCTGGGAPVYRYPVAPQVETRLTVPCNYGPLVAGAQIECAPALPADVQIGWLSPVTHGGGETQAPPLPTDDFTGDVALPPLPPGALSDRGEPAGASTAWNLHNLLCLNPSCNAPLPGC